MKNHTPFIVRLGFFESQAASTDPSLLHAKGRRMRTRIYNPGHPSVMKVFWLRLIVGSTGLGVLICACLNSVSQELSHDFVILVASIAGLAQTYHGF